MDRTLRIVAAQRPPLVYIRGEGADNGDFSGMLVDLLPQLLEAANITRPYKLYNLGAVRCVSYAPGVLFFARAVCCVCVCAWPPP